MFQYTNTIVLNSLTDEASGLKKVQANEEKHILKVLRVNDFLKEGVVMCRPTKAEKAVDGSVTFATLPNEEGLYRINLYVRLSGSQNSYYSNDMVFKGRPFVYEFKGKTTAADLVEIIYNINQLYGDKFLKVEVSGSGVKFTGDNYALFTIAKIEKFVQDNSVFPSINGGTWEEVSKGDITKCVNGFGTYDQILKDLRLPTMEARRWEAVNKEELPIPGTLYNQYVFDYLVDRGILGTDAVGDTVTSITHHVFYVADSISQEFESCLKTAGFINSSEGLYPS